MEIDIYYKQICPVCHNVSRVKVTPCLDFAGVASYILMFQCTECRSTVCELVKQDDLEMYSQQVIDSLPIKDLQEATIFLPVKEEVE